MTYMKILTVAFVLAVLVVPALSSAADADEEYPIPFVPTDRASVELCVVEVVNELREAHGHAPLIHSNEPYDTMLGFTEQRAARPYEYDPVKQFENSGPTDAEVEAFVDAIPDGGKGIKLFQYFAREDYDKTPPTWEDFCQGAANRLAVAAKKQNPLIVGDYLIYITVSAATPVLVGTDPYEVYSRLVTVGGWTSACWGDVQLPEFEGMCSQGQDNGSDDSTVPLFTDTTGSVFATDIDKLAASGITKGCNPPANDRFCPNEPVTRGQMAAFLTRALGLAKGTSVFSDTSDSVFAADIAALADAGITRGCNPPANDRFCPDQPVTRGQMAAFLVRAGLAG